MRARRALRPVGFRCRRTACDRFTCLHACVACVVSLNHGSGIPGLAMARALEPPRHTPQQKWTKAGGSISALRSGERRHPSGCTRAARGAPRKRTTQSKRPSSWEPGGPEDRNRTARRRHHQASTAGAEPQSINHCLFFSGQSRYPITAAKNSEVEHES